MRVPLPGSILRAVARTAVARSPGFYGKADRGGPKNVPVAPPNVECVVTVQSTHC